MKGKCLISFLGLFLISTGAFVSVPKANGELINFNVSGEIYYSAISEVSVGDKWTAMFDIDTTTPDLLPSNSNVGSYVMSPASFDLTVVGISYTRHYGSLQLVVYNDISCSVSGICDSWFLFTPYQQNPPEHIFIALRDPTATMFNSDALPAIPDLSVLDFTEMDVRVVNSEGVDVAELGGYVADITTTTVPEPSTFLLLGAGLAGVGLLRRRFKK